LRGFSGTLAYHTFSSDEENTSGDSDLGSEWDFVVSKKVSSVNLMVKYASYQQGDNSFAKSDTRKIWLTAAMAF
jgi:hypothetical protein